MSLFAGFMQDFEDDMFFGLMFPRLINIDMNNYSKNSVSYMIPADIESDDENMKSLRRSKKCGDSCRPQMNPMHQMNSMMNSMLADPFGMLGGFGATGHHNRREIMPFGFPNMNNIFQNFQINANSPNCHSYSSSTVMTMSSGPDGRPQVYQASHSTRTGPGGVRETQKSVCDSRTGTKKMAIGHHIGDRSHVMEREQNIHSGQMEERQEFINLDEDEAEDFNREWETKTRSGMNAIDYGHSRMGARRQRDDIPAILDRSDKSKTGQTAEKKKEIREMKRSNARNAVKYRK
ncbi:hypothetical protein RUM43_014792 [Polyplax serrata]|uniref:Myeloid leukemia factor n=1 Tax=Polyplax serrata TaxID=468196 RepID=A0AAN8S5W3_POLSC